jgi:hypothetical protein
MVFIKSKSQATTDQKLNYDYKTTTILLGYLEYECRILRDPIQFWITANCH